jgi:hypothetical protein
VLVEPLERRQMLQYSLVADSYNVKQSTMVRECLMLSLADQSRLPGE